MTYESVSYLNVMEIQLKTALIYYHYKFKTVLQVALHQPSYLPFPHVVLKDNKVTGSHGFVKCQLSCD